MSKETFVGILQSAEPLLDNYKKHRIINIDIGGLPKTFYLFKVWFRHGSSDTTGIAKSNSEKGSYVLDGEYTFTRELKNGDVWITGIKRTDAKPSASFGSASGGSAKPSGKPSAGSRYDDPDVQIDMTRTWSFKIATARLMKLVDENSRTLEDRDALARILFLFVHNKTYTDQNFVMKRKQAIELAIDEVDAGLLTLPDFDVLKTEAERLFGIITKPFYSEVSPVEPPASDKHYEQPAAPMPPSGINTGSPSVSNTGASSSSPSESMWQATNDLPF